MIYTIVAVIAVLLACMTDLVLLRTGLLRGKTFWIAYAIIVFFQLLINGLLTGIPVVTYDEAVILGPRLAYAPIEDLGFGFALVLVTISTWVWLGRDERSKP